MWFFFSAYCDVKTLFYNFDIVPVERFIVTAKEKWCVEVRRKCRVTGEDEREKDFACEFLIFYTVQLSSYIWGFFNMSL